MFSKRTILFFRGYKLKKQELFGSNIIKLDNKYTLLEYYLVKDKRGFAKTLYGIKVYKKIYIGGNSIVETSSADNISNSEELVNSILKKLLGNIVMPINLIPVVNDYMAEIVSI